MKQKFELYDWVVINPVRKVKYRKSIRYAVGQIVGIEHKEGDDRLTYFVRFGQPDAASHLYVFTAYDLHLATITKKSLPIQLVEFRKQDIVQHEENVSRNRTTENQENKEYLNCNNSFEYHRRLKNNYEEICNRYLVEFCQKHHLTYDKYVWVGDEVGGTANIEDLFISFDDIRYDIDNNIPEPDFQNWYDKSLEIYELTGEKYMNYPSYCKGAPDNWSEERLKKIRESKNRIFTLQRELDDEIKQYIADSTKSKAHPTNPMVGHF